MSDTLKFVARGDDLVAEPGVTLYVGQSPRYVNREHVKLASGEWGYPATAEPHTCKADSDEGRRLQLLVVRDRALWPADAATAAACGVPFVPLELHDGVWVPVSAGPSASTISNGPLSVLDAASQAAAEHQAAAKAADARAKEALEAAEQAAKAAEAAKAEAAAARKVADENVKAAQALGAAVETDGPKKTRSTSKE